VSDADSRGDCALVSHAFCRKWKKTGHG
jgi:hypothetical protein